MTNEHWNYIVESCYKDIYSFVLRLLGSVEDAREVTQDAFLKGYETLRGDEPLTVFRPWLFTIARNKCIDKRRWWNRWKRLAKELLIAGAEGSATPEYFDSGPVKELPRRQREVFILRHWQGFSTEETSKIMGISEGAVKSHLKRAVEKLKIRLLKEES